MYPSNMRGLNPRSSAWQADALPTKLMLHIGARGRTRTGTVSLPRDFKSLASCLFRHTSILTRLSFLDSLRLPIPPFPYLWQGNQDSNLEVNEDHEVGFRYKKYFAVKAFSYFLLHIYYNIFFNKNQIVSFWLGGWDSNPHSQGQSLDSCGFRDRFLTIRIPPNMGS